MAVKLPPICTEWGHKRAVIVDALNYHLFLMAVVLEIAPLSKPSVLSVQTLYVGSEETKKTLLLL